MLELTSHRLQFRVRSEVSHKFERTSYGTALTTLAALRMACRSVGRCELCTIGFQKGARL